MTHEIDRHQTADVEAQLEALAKEIRSELDALEADTRSALHHAITIGGLLTEAKATVRHGEWRPWLAANFRHSERTAQRWMQVADNSATVADLPTISAAIALLTEPSAPRALPAPAPGAPPHSSAALDQAFDELKKAMNESDDGEWCEPPAWALEIIVSARKSGRLAAYRSRR
jgi:hypothetical protein